jgi:uncharacterized membrane protein YfhO
MKKHNTSFIERFPGVRFLPLCLLTAAIPFLFFIIKGRGFYTLADDFVEQMLPFYVDMVRAVREGGIDTFSHKIDLGTSTILGYTYYGLFSPFFWVCLLFPARAIPYLMGFVFILKYVVAFYTAYWYLRRFVKKDVSAAAGALAYAFSGYQSSNLQFYFFHDAVALFPLLLLGVELVMEKKGADRRKPFLLFAFFVFINCINNYFFFVQEVLFLIVYYLFRFVKKDLRTFVTDTLTLLGGGVLGVGMGAAVFMPNIIFILSNNRVTGGETKAVSFFHDLYHMLVLVKGFILPSDAMMNMSSIMPVEMSIGSCFLPGGLLALTIAYMVKKRKDRITFLLLFLFILSLSPLLSSVFLLFVTDYYRWWYMMVLVMVLAAAKVLDDPKEFPVKPCLIGYLACIAAFVVAILVLHDPDGNSLLLQAGYFTVSVTLACVGALLLFPKSGRYVLVSVSLIAIGTTLLSQQMIRDNMYCSPEDYRTVYDISGKIHTPDPAYRFINWENVLTFPSEAGVTPENCYITTASSSLTEFDSLFDFYDEDGDTRLRKRLVPGLPAAIGAKYVVFSDLLSRESYTDTEREIAEVISKETMYGHEVVIAEYPASPIAYAAQRFIRRSELEQLWVERRGIALLYAMVVNDEDAPLVEDLLDEVTAQEINQLVESDSEHFSAETLYRNAAIATYSEENTARSLQDITRSYKGLTGYTTFDEETILYISLPLDAGWHALVDGQETPIIHSCGMMAIRVPAGEHDIYLHYGTPYFKKGLLISIVSLLVFVVIGGLSFLRKKEK